MFVLHAKLDLSPGITAIFKTFTFPSYLSLAVRPSANLSLIVTACIYSWNQSHKSSDTPKLLIVGVEKYGPETRNKTLMDKLKK